MKNESDEFTVDMAVLDQLVYDQVEAAYKQAKPYIEQHPGKMHLAIPVYIQRMMLRALSRLHGQKNLDLTYLTEWRGLRVIPGYEQTIVFFHEDCHLLDLRYQWAKFDIEINNYDGEFGSDKLPDGYEMATSLTSPVHIATKTGELPLINNREFLYLCLTCGWIKGPIYHEFVKVPDQRGWSIQPSGKWFCRRCSKMIGKSEILFSN